MKTLISRSVHACTSWVRKKDSVELLRIFDFALPWIIFSNFRREFRRRSIAAVPCRKRGKFSSTHKISLDSKRLNRVSVASASPNAVCITQWHRPCYTVTQNAVPCIEGNADSSNNFRRKLCFEEQKNFKFNFSLLLKIPNFAIQNRKTSTKTLHKRKFAHFSFPTIAMVTCQTSQHYSIANGY